MTVTRRTPDGGVHWPGQGRICWSFMVRKFCVATSCPRLRLCQITLPFFGRKGKQLVEACTGGVTPDVPRVNLGVVYCKVRVSLVVHIVKNLPAMQETRVQSLGWEDPLEKGQATHSSIHAWRIPWTEEPGGLQSMGSQRVGHD